MTSFLSANRVIACGVLLLLALVPVGASTPPERPPYSPPGNPEETLTLYETRFSLRGEGNFWVYNVFQGDDTKLTGYRQMEPLFMDSSTGAYHYFRKSRRRNSVGLVLGGLGGFLIGLDLGVNVAEGWRTFPHVTDVISLGGGALMAGVGLVISGSQLSQLELAIEEYNRELRRRWELD